MNLRSLRRALDPEAVKRARNSNRLPPRERSRPPPHKRRGRMLRVGGAWKYPDERQGT